MHHDKVSIGNAVGGRVLLDHDKRADADRDALRENRKIDPSLAHLNRDLSVRKMAPGEAWRYACEVAQSHAKTKTGKTRKLRDNTVVMSMDVLHLPDNWDEVSGGADPMEYFERVALPFERERYGREELANEVSAVVHRDEKLVSPEEYERGVRPGRDHLHYKYVPITEDGKLSHKDVNNRADLKSYHRDLLAYAEAKGYHGLHIFEDAPEKGRKKAQSMPEYQAARQEVERLKSRKSDAEAEAERAGERLRSAKSEAEAEAERLRRVRAEADAEAERLERLRRAREGAEQRVEVLEAVAAECRAADAAPIGAKGRFLDGISALCAGWLKRLGVAVKEVAAKATGKLSIQLRGDRADEGIRETSAHRPKGSQVSGRPVVVPAPQAEKGRTKTS